MKLGESENHLAQFSTNDTFMSKSDGRRNKTTVDFPRLPNDTTQEAQRLSTTGPTTKVPNPRRMADSFPFQNEKFCLLDYLARSFLFFLHVQIFLSMLWLLYRGADNSLARPGRTKARKHVRDARDFNNIEMRAVIKFFLLQGKAPKEIHAILTEILACFLRGRAKDLSAPLYCSVCDVMCLCNLLSCWYLCTV